MAAARQGATGTAPWRDDRLMRRLAEPLRNVHVAAGGEKPWRAAAADPDLPVASLPGGSKATAAGFGPAHPAVAIRDALRASPSLAVADVAAAVAAVAARLRGLPGRERDKPSVLRALREALAGIGGACVEPAAAAAMRLPPRPPPELYLDPQWANRVRMFKWDGSWLLPQQWGPPPGEPGCRAPTSVLAFYGYPAPAIPATAAAA